MKSVEWFVDKDGELYCEITLDDGSNPTIIALTSVCILDIVGALIDFRTELKK